MRGPFSTPIHNPAPAASQTNRSIGAATVDPEARTITLFTWKGLLGAKIAVVAMPMLWLVLALRVVLSGPA